MERTIKILAVDNEPSVSLSMRYVFSGPCYNLTCVGDGNAALSLLRAGSDPYDVIVVDHKMPILTGLELVGEIRKRGIDGKIIVVSANLDSETRETYRKMGVQALFPKPFDVAQLRSAVDDVTVA